jgi:outer membrane protein
MRTRKILTLLMAFIIPGLIYSQEKLSLSLEQATNYSLEYNKQIKNAALAVELAQKKINESISGFLPQADLSMDYANYMGAEMKFQFSEDMPVQVVPFKPTSNAYFRVNQMIFSGSFIVGLQMVKIYKEMTGTNYLKTEQSLRENTTKAYQNALVSALSIAIINENIDNMKQIYENTKAMVSVGMAERLDLDQFEVQMSTLDNALKSAERQKELAYNLLRFQLGVDANTQIELTDSLDYFLDNFDFTGMVDKSFNMQNNLDYQAMLHQERLSFKQVDMQKTNYLPTINSYYQYTSKILKSDFDLSPKNVIGLSLSLPLLSSGMRNSQLNEAKIQYETTLNNKSLLEDQLTLQEKQLRYNLESAVEQYLNRKNNVDVTLRIYKNYQFKYEQGIASSLDLSTANNNYLQAESDYLMSIVTLLDAQLALKKLMNTL